MPNHDDGQNRVADVAQDIAALIGVGSITYGAHLIYDPAAYIVGGLFLLAGALLAARKG